MHPALIQAALKMQGVTQAEIASQCGDVSSTAVYQVINGRSRSKRIEMRIAAITNIALAELWPDWYGAKKRSKRLTAAQAASALRDARVGG